MSDMNSTWRKLMISHVNKIDSLLNGVNSLADKRYPYEEKEVRWYFDQIFLCLDELKDGFFHSGRTGLLKRFEEIKPCPLELRKSDFEENVMEEKLKKNEIFHQNMERRVGRLIGVLNQMTHKTNRTRYSYSQSEVVEAFNHIYRSIDISLHHFISIEPFDFSSYDQKSANAVQERRR